VLSGPDIQELKRVRTALRKCIKLARSLLHESEYLKFTKPNINLLEDKGSLTDNDESF
jgi:phosphopantetheinyl transferase (holo-ACP synthase)